MLELDTSAAPVQLWVVGAVAVVVGSLQSGRLSLLLLRSEEYYAVRGCRLELCTA